MTFEEMGELQQTIFDEIVALRSAGHTEYADTDDNTFSNFDKLAEELGIAPEQVLWTYAMKHKDGIASWIRGHRSQREDVRGRINDLINYLTLLRGLIERREACSDRLPF